MKINEHDLKTAIECTVSSLKGLKPEERRLHDEAIAKGEPDEICTGCTKAFLAGEGLKSCSKKDCPYKLSPIDRRLWVVPLPDLTKVSVEEALFTICT